MKQGIKYDRITSATRAAAVVFGGQLSATALRFSISRNEGQPMLHPVTKNKLFLHKIAISAKAHATGNNIQGGGTKGHVNLVEKAIFYGMEFHMYAFKFQQINNNNYT